MTYAREGGVLEVNNLNMQYRCRLGEEIGAYERNTRTNRFILK